MIIDSHAHLLSSGMDTENIIKEMSQDGLEKIINIGTTAQDSSEGVELAKNNKNVYTTVGIHPEYASSVTDEDLSVIDKLAEEEKVVAVGEIGLDYHYGDENKEKQKEVFVKQIKIAKKHNLPICIHTRSAKEDTYQILKENINSIVLPSVMHCFSEDKEYMEKFLDLGFYISFAGNITFKKSDRSFLKNIPLNKILVETDSPYLSPEPVRGRPNVPKNVNYTAQKIADILEIDVEKFKQHTLENTYNVFKKLKRDENEWI